MNLSNQLHYFPGGLRAAVLPMKDDLVHQSVLGSALYDAVSHEAMTHGAAFDGSRFGKIIDAVKAGKIQAWFIVAGWESCQTGGYRLPLVVGAAIELPTVLTKWDGNEFKHYPAVYGEDTCLPRDRLRKLIQEKPKDCFFSEDAKLGDFFQEQRIKTVLTEGSPLFGMTPKGCVAEYAARSAAMAKILSNNGANMDTGQKCPILQLDSLSTFMKNRLEVPVEIAGLTSNNGDNPCQNIFLTNWESPDSRQKIVASFTEAISTFTGDPIVRVQLTSNGILPNSEALKDILSSLIIAGHDEIALRQWGTTENNGKTQSPIIPIGGSNREILIGLMSLNKSEVLPLRRAKDLSSIFGTKVPTMRIHAPNEPEIINALQALGAQVRKLGPHTMLPVTMDFQNTKIDGMVTPPARPIKAIPLTEAPPKPIFSLVA